MNTIGLDDVTDGMVSSEESLVIDMVRTKYPKLDLRRGTVLRDLLVGADAAVGAAFRAQADEQRDCASLLRLSEREESGGTVDPDDVAAVLSNFNIDPISGTSARGYVRMTMSDSREYVVMKGSVFTTSDGVSFSASSDVTASPSPDAGQEQLRSGAQGKWFLVPVECDSAGSAGNIGQGTDLKPGFELFGFVSAAAYRTFSGGSDMEPIGRTVDRIRQSLSSRGLLTRSSTEAALRDEFDSSDNPIVAVSTCGYGSAAQRRDRHNAFGVAVGGRVDIYVRNFTSLPTDHITKKGVSNGDGTYTVEVTADEMPGMYCVHRVSDPESNAFSSYVHSERWTDCGSSSTWHDFDVSSDASELMGTVWRGVSITVSEASPTVDGDGNPVFRVEVVRLPAATGLQGFVDSDLVRSTGIDHVVRCPVIVQMSVHAVVRIPSGTLFDKDAAVSRICEYVNTAGFVGRITRSEISSVLIGLGATSVDLANDGSMLNGFGYGSDGSAFTLSGDALDLADALPGPAGMVSRETGVFVVEPENVVIDCVLE